MKTQMQKDVKVSAEKGAPERSIALTMEFDITEEQVQELAMSSLVITWQGKARKQGDAYLKGLDGKALTVKASEVMAKQARIVKVLTPAEALAAIKAMPEGPEKEECIRKVKESLGF